jgi:transcriptional regulator with XRE-family HTH domain
MNLLKRTTELVSKSGLSQRDIAEGAGVGVDWFKKFAQGRIPSPGVEKVQRVYDFLSKSGRHAA